MLLSKYRAYSSADRFSCQKDTRRNQKKLIVGFTCMQLRRSEKASTHNAEDMSMSTVAALVRSTRRTNVSNEALVAL